MFEDIHSFESDLFVALIFYVTGGITVLLLLELLVHVVVSFLVPASKILKLAFLAIGRILSGLLNRLLSAAQVIFNTLSNVLSVIPTALLAVHTSAVGYFFCSFCLGGFYIIIGYSSPQIANREIQELGFEQNSWEEHSYKFILHNVDLDRDSPPMGLVLSLLLHLFVMTFFIHCRHKYARNMFDLMKKRCALEKKIAQAELTTKHVPKQIVDIERSLTCLICVDRLTEPYILSPCGHTFDRACLDKWFRTAHPSPADEELALTIDPRGALFSLRRKKFCPLCHVEVVRCPAPARALLPLDMEPLQEEERSPWRDLFMEKPPSRVEVE